jgi:hypothetical protein
MRVIRYAAVVMMDNNCRGVLDRPVKPGDDSEGAARTSG